MPSATQNLIAAALGQTLPRLAIGMLNMATGLWVGAHPGFEVAVVKNGVGDFDVKLTADADPATTYSRCTTSEDKTKAGQKGPCHGVGNRDINIVCGTFQGSDCAAGPGAGWNAGAASTLGGPVAFDGLVVIEVLSFV